MSPTRRRRRGLLLNSSLVLVLAALGVTSYVVAFRDDPQPAAAAATVAVARGTVTASVTSSGTVESARTAAPQFATSGTVTAVLVTVGQHVAKGQALARVGSGAAERALTIAGYNLTAAKNSVTAAEEALDEAEDAAADDSSATGAATDTEQTQQTQAQQATSVASAEASLARARADRESAEQNVEAAEDEVAATTLTAPIAGTVTAVNGQVGGQAGSSSGTSQSSQQGTSSTQTATTSSSGFVEIADLSALRVVASFPEADALKIRAKQAATVTFNANPGSPVTATLASVSPTPATTNGVVAYDATFTLAKIPAGTRLGQTADVSVVTAKASNALYVPTMAISSTGGTHTVTLSGGETRTVRVGVQGDSYTQVTSGLAAGDEVVLVSGNAAAATARNGTGRQGQGQFPGFGQAQPPGEGTRGR